MNLDTTTKRVEIVLGEAMTTAECDITASYAAVGAGVFQLAEADLTTNGTTPVVVVAAPPSGRQNQVKEITFFNNDTVTHELTLRINNGGTMRIVAQRSVPPNGDFRYVSDLGVAASASAPAILLESGAAGAKISALPAFNLALPPVGTELLPVVEVGADTKMTLAQLYTLFAEWVNFVATNPLDAAGGSGSAGEFVILQAGIGDTAGAGGGARLLAGAGGTNGSGGSTIVQAGNAGGGDKAGGTISVTTGAGAGTGAGGALTITASASGSGATGDGGSIALTSGAAASTDGNGGGISLSAGGASGTGTAGSISLSAGSSGTGATGDGGQIDITGGAVNSTNGNGGDVAVHLQFGAGAGRQGLVIISNLPTGDPGVSGALWVLAGVLQVSP